MLLAIDIGNTNLTFGLFQGEKILHKFRLTTSLPRTSDEFGVQIVEQLSHKDVSADDVEDVIICSVVPKIMYSLTSGVKKYLDCDPVMAQNRVSALQRQIRWKSEQTVWSMRSVLTFCMAGRCLSLITVRLRHMIW